MNELKELNPENEFFIVIDSGGCVFDTMEIKHKECFCPNFIRSFQLQKIQKYARETWEFVNLYSIFRGIDRFHAVIKAFHFLAGRPDIQARGFALPDIFPLEDWIKNEMNLTNSQLEQRVNGDENGILQTVLDWSKNVNRNVSEMVVDMPPFAEVMESLTTMSEQADTLVVSQSPVIAVQREWTANGMDAYVRHIAGQEHGTKTEILSMAVAGQYPRDKVLMIGDAPGDYQAARANGILFYPIIPGYEVASWTHLHEDALHRFFEGSFAGNYENNLLRQFYKYLPEDPPWENKSSVPSIDFASELKSK